MKLILWWSFASLLQVSELCFCKQQQQKTLQTMLLFVACMSGLSGHNGCSFFMFLCDTVSLCYYTSLDQNQISESYRIFLKTCARMNVETAMMALLSSPTYPLKKCMGHTIHFTLLEPGTTQFDPNVSSTL